MVHKPFISTAKITDIRMGIGYFTAPEKMTLEYRLFGTVATSLQSGIRDNTLR